MELTLKRLLEQAEFKKGRGYDRDEVDDFLDRAVAMAAKVEVRLTQALEAEKAAKARGSEPSGAETGTAGPSPEQIEAEVERRLQARLAAAPTAPTGPSEEEAAEEVRRTLVLAQRTADAAVREAREDAAKILADAKERASKVTAEAEAAATAARRELSGEIERDRQAAHDRLAGEIAELEGAREALRSDLGVLERHVEEQRGQLRSSVGELQRLLDDPAGFRMAPTPALLDPEIPSLAKERPSGDAERTGSEATPGDDDRPVDPPAGQQAGGSGSGPSDTGPGGADAGARTAGGSDDPEGPGDEGSRGSLDFGSVDHAPPGTTDLDSGPATAQVSALDLGMDDDADEPAPADEDAFLSELRKAMSDDQPLGPRESAFHEPQQDFDDEDRRGWRFGKRR